MGSSPILHGKRALVFGAGGSAGAAIAKEFAAEGAEVFLAGRTESTWGLPAALRRTSTGRQ